MSDNESVMIPDEAVDAAADIVRQAQWGYLTPERAVRYILEAAAPHMLAEAWDEGYQAGVREEQPGWTKNPYGPTK